MSIPVFFASDERYAPYLSVAIKSLCENTKSDINIFVLDSGIDEFSKKSIEIITNEYDNTSLEFINVNDDNIFSEYKENLYYKKSVYLRLLIPELKPEIKKAIYLDTDIIVNTDISELYNTDLKEYITGAVYEEFMEKYHSVTTKRSLKLNNEHKYFNSGVLLINCEKWRNEKITEKLINTYEKYKSQIFYPDQDLLNIVFSVNNYFQLDPKFNYFVQNPVKADKNVILHYDGGLKPWKISQTLNTEIINYLDIWREYANKTPVKDIIEERSIYKDKTVLRLARVKKAQEKMLLNIKTENKQ